VTLFEPDDSFSVVDLVRVTQFGDVTGHGSNGSHVSLRALPG
jgi:hypothetical protein